MTQRVIKGALFAPKKRCPFGLFIPTPKFNIFEFGEFNNKATSRSSARLGKIKTHIARITDGDGQGIAVSTDNPKVKRRDFERLINKIFSGCELNIDKWITRISRRDDRLFWASIHLELIKKGY